MNKDIIKNYTYHVSLPLKASSTTVDEAFKGSDTYSKFKQYKKSKKYSPIYVYKKRELLQSDVVFFYKTRVSKSK